MLELLVLYPEISELSQVKEEVTETGEERDSQFVSSFLIYHSIFLHPFVTSPYLTCFEFTLVAAGLQATSSAHFWYIIFT